MGFPNYFILFLVITIFGGGALFISGALVGAFLVWAHMNPRLKKREKELNKLEKEKGEIEEIASGLEGFNEKIQEKIDKRKSRLIEKIKEKGSIRTKEAAEELGDVSERTALRYLSELEEEDRVKQTKEHGPKVRYKLAG